MIVFIVLIIVLIASFFVFLKYNSKLPEDLFIKTTIRKIAKGTIIMAPRYMFTAYSYDGKSVTTRAPHDGTATIFVKFVEGDKAHCELKGNRSYHDFWCYVNDINRRDLGPMFLMFWFYAVPVLCFRQVFTRTQMR